MAILGDLYQQRVATYLTSRGRNTSEAVARSLLEVRPDDFGLGDGPVTDVELEQLRDTLALLRREPANDAAPVEPLAARAETSAAVTATLSTAGGMFETFARRLAALGFAPRKCDPNKRPDIDAVDWQHVTTVRVVFVTQR